MRSRRSLALVVLALFCVLRGAAPASAHVGVKPAAVPAGTDALLTFHIPNERQAAATTSVELVLPPEAGFTTVQPGAPAGWTVTPTSTSVTWTGGSIAPRQSADFPVTLGPFPSTPERLVFKVLQTYDNGEVVRWIEVPAEGAAEPAHPAAVVRIAPAPATTAPVTTAPATTAPATTVPASTAPPETTLAPVETSAPDVTVTADGPDGPDGPDGEGGDEGGDGGSALGPVIGGAVVVVLVGAGVFLERRRRRA